MSGIEKPLNGDPIEKLSAFHNPVVYSLVETPSSGCKIMV
jgi:hypothetical protein